MRFAGDCTSLDTPPRCRLRTERRGYRFQRGMRHRYGMHTFWRCVAARVPVTANATSGEHASWTLYQVLVGLAEEAARLGDETARYKIDRASWRKIMIFVAGRCELKISFRGEQ